MPDVFWLFEVFVILVISIYVAFAVAITLPPSAFDFREWQNKLKR